MMDGSKSQHQNQPRAVPLLPDEAQSASTPPKVSRQKSVLQTLEQRGRQKRRRRPQAWAIKVANSFIAVRQFLREKLPNSILRRKRELITAVASFLMHLVGALLLTLWLLPPESRDSVFTIISGRINQDVLEDSIEVVEIVHHSK